MKNDANKRIWNMRTKYPDMYPMPFQFYYAVPYKMKDKALFILDEWQKQNHICGKTGLLGVFEQKPHLIGLKDVTVIRRAPINKEAKKLSVKDTITMAKNQSGTLCSMAVHQARQQLPDKDNSIEYYI